MTYRINIGGSLRVTKKFRYYIKGGTYYELTRKQLMDRFGVDPRYCSPTDTILIPKNQVQLWKPS